MRQYTLMFMEQRIGVAHLTPVAGPAGIATFAAEDEEAALAYIAARLLEPLSNCVHAELSSMQLVADPAADSGTRLLDDSHANPYVQEVYVRYDPTTKTVEVDWESTRTALFAGAPLFRVTDPRSGTG